jgi:hypothetical protein
MINFLTEIINNGCSIQCLYDQKNNNDGPLNLITSYNYDLKPNFENNNEIELFSLLISGLVYHFSNEISDQYDYDIEKGYGTITINKNEIVKIKLPDNIRDLFINIDYKDIDENTFINSILEKIMDIGDNNMIEMFKNLINMEVSTNIISAIRNNMIENIGIGKIFKAKPINQNQNENLDHIID